MATRNLTRRFIDARNGAKANRALSPHESSVSVAIFIRSISISELITTLFDLIRYLRHLRLTFWKTVRVRRRARAAGPISKISYPLFG